MSVDRKTCSIVIEGKEQFIKDVIFFMADYVDQDMILFLNGGPCHEIKFDFASVCVI